MTIRRLGALALTTAVLALPAAEPADGAAAVAKPKRDRSLQAGWHGVLGWEPLGFLYSPDLYDLKVSSDVGARLTAAVLPPLGVDSEDPATVQRATGICSRFS